MARAEKVIYWITTGFVLFAMSWSFVMYYFFHDRTVAMFQSLNYPTYIIYPLGCLKLIGIIVIITNRYRDVKEWVYGAYLINVLLAFAAHLSVGDGLHGFALLLLLCTLVSYIYSNKVRGRPKRDLLNLWSVVDADPQ